MKRADDSTLGTEPAKRRRVSDGEETSASDESDVDADCSEGHAASAARVAEGDGDGADDGMGTGRTALPNDTARVDCGAVFASARGAVEASFVRGAGKQARKHQADAVAKLLSLIWLDQRAAQTRPINYLIQHAAGTGKSLTIAALALSLLSFTPAGSVITRTGPADTMDDAAEGEAIGGSADRGALSGGRAQGGEAAGERVFSTVLVLTDRLQLDKQLGDTVESMLAAHGESLVRCSTSAELDAALAGPPGNCPRAVLSTLQKFAGLEAKGRDAAGAVKQAHASPALQALLHDGGGGGRIAVIADEAHRSHGASTSLAMNRILGGRSGQSPRLTFIGFSATPSHTALRLFGVNRRGKQGPEFAPAHCYSMAEAVRDGLVHDVLAHYSCVSASFAAAPPPPQPGAAAAHPTRAAQGSGDAVRARDTSVPETPPFPRGKCSGAREVECKAALVALHFGRLLAAEAGRFVSGGKVDARARFQPRGMLVCRRRGLYSLCVNLRHANAMHVNFTQQVCRSRADVVAYTRCLRHLLAGTPKSPQSLPQSATARLETRLESATAREHLVQRLRDGSGGGGGGGGGHAGVQVAEALVPGGDVCVEWSVYGAFSGEVGGDDADGGVATECSLNAGQGCLETAELLVVCNKLETGFDEPRIAAMYVDRCLASARCVQVCSTPRVA